jgi:hypothetical protein
VLLICRTRSPRSAEYRNHIGPLPVHLLSVQQRKGACKMQFDDTRPGDHLEKQPGKPPAVVANEPERQGVTGHNVRYMLLFGIAGVVIAFALVWISYLT